eukprot:Polyplicarium_translucidae@DN3111_c0_g1_i2.p1
MGSPTSATRSRRGSHRGASRRQRQRAIDDLMRKRPETASLVAPSVDIPVDAALGSTLSGRTVFQQFSAVRGEQIRILSPTEAARSTFDAYWPDLTVFLMGPLRIFADDLPGFSVEVSNVMNGVTGPLMGMVDTDPLRWKGCIEDLVQSRGFYIDGGGWARNPHGDARLCGWNPGTLKNNDILHVSASVTGDLQVFVNRECVCCVPFGVTLADSRGTFVQYWGFFSLSGTVGRIRIAAHSAQVVPLSH